MIAGWRFSPDPPPSSITWFVDVSFLVCTTEWISVINGHMLAGSPRSLKTCKSPGILEWLFQALEKTWNSKILTEVQESPGISCLHQLYSDNLVSLGARIHHDSLSKRKIDRFNNEYFLCLFNNLVNFISLLKEVYVAYATAYATYISFSKDMKFSQLTWGRNIQCLIYNNHSCLKCSNILW